jgi:hypothetical protein
MRMLTLNRVASTNNVDVALQAGRHRPPARRVVVVESWYVLVFRGGTFQNNTVVGGEPIDLVVLTCESGRFGEALRDAGYDLSDLGLEYVREKA